MEKRSQFTFYESIREAIRLIKKAADRALAYDVVCDYALYGTEPDMDKLPDTVAILFLNVKPNLDASRRKAASGKAGGTRRQTPSKPEANGKQTPSNPEANPKREETAREKEKEIEIEKEKEIENECYGEGPGASAPLAPSSLFSDFWQEYPTARGGREQAWQAWRELRLDRETARRVLSALAVFKSCREWQKSDGQYIPSAGKFLLERQWEKPPRLSGEEIPKGASGELGEAELAAIQKIMRETGGGQTRGTA